MYMFKCFSTGQGGSAIKMMMALWDLSFNMTAEIIRNDYRIFLNSNKRPEAIQIDAPQNWFVSSEETRSWTKNDADLWLPFNIGSSMLTRYNVKPLSYYYMRRDQSDMRSQAFRVSGSNLYGYYTKEGLLYKVYQPGRTPKALKVRNYIQGSDQVEGHKTMILTSSLKDIMAVKSWPLVKADVIANDSESVYFTREQLQVLYQKYDCIIVYMNSDEAGIKSMKYYEETYGLPFIFMPLAKDPSDINKFFGWQTAQAEAIPKLIRAAEIYSEQKENIRRKLYKL